MREYAKVAPQFWTGPTGRDLRHAGPLAQVVALYLITGPQSLMSGLYHISLPTIAHEIGSPLQGASKALRRVCEVEMASYDETEELVWVPEMAKFQIGEELSANDKRVTGVLRMVLPFKNHLFFKSFVEKYHGPFSLESSKEWAAVEKALRSPFEAPSKPRARAGTRAGERKENTSPTSVGIARVRFGEFWNLHHQGPKAEAEKAYRDLRSFDPSDDDLLAVLARQIEERRRADRVGVFSPRVQDLVRWFRRRRWEDAPLELDVASGDPLAGAVGFGDEAAGGAP